jgi:hypothetical protein
MLRDMSCKVAWMMSHDARRTIDSIGELTKEAVLRHTS